jgi:hypothetical protein
MISPDAGNMGVKAIYVWCGMLAPTVAILYFFYPEVSRTTLGESDRGNDCLPRTVSARLPVELTGSLTSSTSEAFPLATSRRPRRWLNKLEGRATSLVSLLKRSRWHHKRISADLA